MMKQQFFSTTQLAGLLGISRVSIFRKIKKGEIKAIKTGRSYAIDKKYLPFITGRALGKQEKEVINKAVKKTVREYGETLRLLGNE